MTFNNYISRFLIVVANMIFYFQILMSAQRRPTDVFTVNVATPTAVTSATAMMDGQAIFVTQVISILNLK